MPYIAREQAGADIPREVAQLITGTISRESAALSLGTVVPTTTRDSRIPVLSAAPQAHWVEGDTGLKQTSNADFGREAIIAEEIATIVAIPDSVIDDSDYDLWAALQPLLARAAARTIDAAVLFGTDKPNSWPDSLIGEATAANQTISPGDDPVEDVLNAAEALGTAGYSPTAAWVRPGWEYAAAARRSDALVANPIGSGEAMPLQLAGLPLWTRPVYSENGYQALVADWGAVMIGLRQDIRVEFFNSGVLTDSAGNITMNLLQRDTTACRMTMRVGYRLAKPINNVDDTPGVPVAVVVDGS